MDRNKTLIGLRYGAGLTRKKAAKGMNMPVGLLKSYEEGYSFISDDKVKRFADFYGVDPEVFLEDDLVYSGMVSSTPWKKPKKEANFMDKLLHVLGSGRTLIAVIITFLICCLGTGISAHYCVDSTNNPRSYYPSEVTQVLDDVYSGGEEGEVPLYLRIFLMTTFTGKTIQYSETERLSVSAPDGGSNYGLSVFFYARPYAGYESEEGGTAEESFIMFLNKGGDISFGYRNPDVFALEPFDGFYENGRLVFDEADPEIGGLTEEQQKQAEEMFPVFLEKVNAYLSSIGSSLDFPTFISKCIVYGEVVENVMTLSLLFIYFFACLGFFSGAMVFVSLWRRSIRKKQAAAVIENHEEEEHQNESAEMGKPREAAEAIFSPIPRNRRSFLVCKEGYFKVLLLAGLLFGTSSVVLSFLDMFFPWIGIGYALDFNAYKAVTNVFVYLTVFAIFFVKIDVIVQRKSILLSIFTISMMAAYFYLFEILALRLLSNAKLLENVAASLLPANIFLGMAALLALAYFALYCPSWANRKWKRILFHSLSAIPIAYLFLSFLLPYLQEEGLILLPSAVRLLLQTRSLEACVFISVCILFTLVCKLLLQRKYGEKGAAKVMTGNVYQLSKNLLLCLMLLVFGILGWTVPLDSAASSLLSLSNDRWLLCLIPFFLLYRPRIPKGNIYQDFAFNFGYLTFYMAPYVICAIIFIVM